MKVIFKCSACDVPCTLEYEYPETIIIPLRMPAPVNCPFIGISHGANWVRQK